MSQRGGKTARANAPAGQEFGAEPEPPDEDGPAILVYPGWLTCCRPPDTYNPRQRPTVS